MRYSNAAPEGHDESRWIQRELVLDLLKIAQEAAMRAGNMAALFDKELERESDEIAGFIKQRLDDVDSAAKRHI